MANKAVNSDAFSFAALTTNAPVTADVRQRIDEDKL